MILYKKEFLKDKRNRKQKTVKIHLDELPVRPNPKYTTPKDQKKFIKSVENIIRSSLEYKAYIRFLKDNLDMNRCAIFKNIKSGDGKRYRIEIHHEPFTLFDIVESVIEKRIAYNESISALKIADEVMDLHYQGKIGLIPLSVTMHELVHNGRIFIPLQYIYHQYDQFYNEYKDYMNPALIDKIDAKVNLSLKSDGYISDVLDTEFVVLNVDGFEFPQIPEEWKDVLSYNNDSVKSAIVEKTQNKTSLIFN